jgi:Helix-turn-helix domain of resolvase
MPVAQVFHPHGHRQRAFDSITMLKFGRKPKLAQHQIAEAIRRRDAGEELTDIERSYNVSHSTIS